MSRGRRHYHGPASNLHSDSTDSVEEYKDVRDTVPISATHDFSSEKKSSQQSSNENLA